MSISTQSGLKYYGRNFNPHQLIDTKIFVFNFPNDTSPPFLQKINLSCRTCLGVNLLSSIKGTIVSFNSIRPKPGNNKMAHSKKWIFLLSFSIYRPFFPNISWHQRGETKETGWQYDRSVPKTQSSLVSRWQLRSFVRTGSKLSLLSLSSGEENLLSKKIQALLSRNWVGSIQKIEIKNIPYKL